MQQALNKQQLVHHHHATIHISSQFSGGAEEGLVGGADSTWESSCLSLSSDKMISAKISPRSLALQPEPRYDSMRPKHFCLPGPRPLFLD